MVPAWAEEAPIAVLYPNLNEPYREIFEKIIEGIKSKPGAPISRHPLDSDTDLNALSSTLQRQNSKVVIALGRQGMQVASGLNKDIGVVIGGVLTATKSEAREQRVISLAPDPALLFAQMKMLMPTVKRVFVVYDPDINGWLIKLAAEAAQAQGLELVANKAQDARSAIKFYQGIFAGANSRRDALWLPQDSSTVEERSILPLVLQSSWDTNIAVFSSNSAHVRRGVLFSLYPNNVALGKSLTGLAHGLLTSTAPQREILPLRDVLIAVNLRTAKHLGLNLNAGRHQSFDMTFPEQ